MEPLPIEQTPLQSINDIQIGKVCYMDEWTIRSLELFQNNLEPTNRMHSLLGVINRTKTANGYKTLKANIIRPSADLQTIEERLDCIDYLVANPDKLFAIHKSLTNFGDVDLDHLIQELINTANKTSRTVDNKTVEKRLQIVVTLRKVLAHIDDLKEAMFFSDQPMLNAYSQALDDQNFFTMFAIIDEKIKNEDKHSNQKKKKRDMINVIRNGSDTLLDVTRKTYLEAIYDMNEYVQALATEEDLPIKLSYQEGRGHYLQLNKEALGPNFRMPSQFIRVFATRNLFTFTTVELMRCNVRINMSYQNSLKMCNDLLSDLISSISSYCASIFKIIEVLAFIDMIINFAEMAYNSKGRLVRPTFNKKGVEIIGGRHIILEKVMNADDIKENDTHMLDHNFALIIGPNMGGKTVYLKQVALIHIMAQMGCFVPATKANLMIYDQIIVRSGSDNEYESTCSSYMNEMKAMTSVLRNLDHINSLVVIDELGRGTSYEDGSSYSFAVAEELAARNNVYSLFATHFPLMRILPQLYNNVRVFQFKIRENELTLIFSHELNQESVEDSHYGLKLAEYSNLPREIVDTAKRMASALL